MLRERAPVLPVRLAAVASLVPPGARVADIGCDHGLLALHLAGSGRCSFCVATEIDDAAIARSRRPPEGAEWASRLAWRVGDGLQAIAPEDRVDTIVLAGLGGATIARLLSTPRLALIGPNRLVVQPQTDTAGVRRWFVDHGWALIAETIVRERGRYHEIAAAERGDGRAGLEHPALSLDDVLAAGPFLLRSGSGDVVALWEDRRRRLERIVASGASGAMADRAAADAARAQRILAVLTARHPDDGPVTSDGG